MTQDEAFKYYEEALELADAKHREACKDAKEWLLKKLKVIRAETEPTPTS